MIGFLKGAGLVVLLFIAALILTTVSSQAGMVVSVALLLVSIIALFKPLPALKLGHRGFSLAVLLFVGLPITIAAIGINSDKRESDFIALKSSDPAAYLAALKAKDESRWLAEMQSIAPDQYAVEIAKIEAEKARKEAEQLAAEAEKIEKYKDRLKREISGIPGVDLSTYTADVNGINMAVVLFGAWAMIYEEGTSLSLDKEGQKLRRQFRDAVVKAQTSAFPKLRDAYGPAMSKQLWEVDGSAKTFGAGFRTIEFVNVAFAANRNIKETQTQMQENFMMLRFTRAQYKWFKQASEYQYYDMKPPKDSDIVRWTSNGAFVVLD